MYEIKDRIKRYLDNIYELSINGNNLNISELRFLYGINGLTKLFELDNDLKIMEIKSKRDLYQDLSIVFNCHKDEIGLNYTDLKTGKIKYYLSDIVIDEHILEDDEFKKICSNLKYIRGNVIIKCSLDKNFFTNLEEIGGTLSYHGTESECFVNLKIVGDDAICPFITNSKGFEYLESIGGSAYFDSLLTDEYFYRLEKIGNSLQECHFVFKNLIKIEKLKRVNFFGNDKSSIEFKKFFLPYESSIFHPLINLLINDVISDEVGLISFIRRLDNLEKIEGLCLTLDEIRILNNILTVKEKKQLKHRIYLYLENPSSISLDEYKALMNSFSIYSVVVNGLVKKVAGSPDNHYADDIDSKLWLKYLKKLNDLTRNIDKMFDFDDPNREKKMFLILCNRIVENTSYDIKADENFNVKHHSFFTNEIVGALTGKCSCGGRAGILKDASAILGIKVIDITGSNEIFGGHAWNQAFLDGEWYNVDITWDDKFILNKETTHFLLKSDDDFNYYGVKNDQGFFNHNSLNKYRSFENVCNTSIDDAMIREWLYYEENMKKNWLQNIISLKGKRRK